ncbi:MAG TPA: hypothetical protein VGK53_23400 [Propionicimonas sp.]
MTRSNAMRASSTPATKADGFDIGKPPEAAEAVSLVHHGSMAGIGDSRGAVFDGLGESGGGG